MSSANGNEKPKSKGRRGRKNKKNQAQKTKPKNNEVKRHDLIFAKNATKKIEEKLINANAILKPSTSYEDTIKSYFNDLKKCSQKRCKRYILLPNGTLKAVPFICKNEDDYQLSDKYKKYVNTCLAEILAKDELIRTESASAEEDMPATEAQIAHFTNCIYGIHEMTHKSILLYKLESLPLLRFAEDLLKDQKTCEDGNGKEQKKAILLIPLRRGLTEIFPDIYLLSDIEYIDYSRPVIIIELIKIINLIVQRIVFDPRIEFRSIVNILQEIFRINIENTKILTYEMLKGIYYGISNYLIQANLIDLLNEKIADEWKEKPVIRTKLTENEVKLIEPEVRYFLQQFEPFIISDFLEHDYIRNRLKNDKRIYLENMYRYFMKYKLNSLAPRIDGDDLIWI